MIRFAGLPANQGLVAGVLRHDGPRADEGILAYGVTGEGGAFCSQGGALLDKSRPHMIHLPDFGSGIVDVGEHHRRATEDAVCQGDAFI